MKYINVLSFGAGTQSTAMVLLALEKRIEVDLIIFADTGAETPDVLAHAKKMQRMVQEQSDIDFIIAKPKESARESMERYLWGDNNRSNFPFWVKSGLMRRQCTGDFKIIPIEKAIRSYVGLQHGQHFPKKEQHVNMLLGITTDEILRVKDNMKSWISNMYPLIELGWDRQAAINYNTSKGVSAPRSACFFCPYKSNHEWSELKRKYPGYFDAACGYDRALQKAGRNFKNVREEMYLHKKKCSLVEALENYELQGSLFEEAVFEKANECEGHCFL